MKPRIKVTINGQVCTGRAGQTLLEIDPQAQAEAQERRRQLWQAIDALPEVHRTPFLLREMEGYSYREIAKALGLEEGTVKSRLARARVLLRSELLSHGNFWGREASKETKGKGGDLE